MAARGMYWWRAVDVESAAVYLVVAADAGMAETGVEAASGGMYCWKRGCGVGGERCKATVVASWYVGMGVNCPSAVLMPGSMARIVRMDWQMVVYGVIRLLVTGKSGG